VIIKSVKLDNFGKFEGYSLDLGSEFNVIYGDNEDGKSTIMSFILMMFYGHGGRSTDLSKNPRKKFKPWNGKDMRGRIFFEHEGNNYRLERTFGNSNTTDDVSLWNEDTSEKVKLSSKSDPGEVFFGVGEEAFSRSVFIGQGGTLLSTSTKKDEITEKLLNLVTTGSEEVNYEEALNKLQSQEELLVSKNRKNGIFMRTKEELERLAMEKRQAMTDEQDKIGYQDLVEKKQVLLKEEEKKRKSLEDSFEGFSLYSSIREHEEAIKREKRRTELLHQLEETEKKLTTPFGKIEDGFVEKAEEKLKSLSELVSEGKYIREELEESERLLTELKESVPMAVSKETFENAFRMDKERRVLTGILAENKDLLREQSEKRENQERIKDLQREYNETKRNYHIEELDLLNLKKDYEAVEKDHEERVRDLEELKRTQSVLTGKAENKSSYLVHKEKDLLELEKEQESRIQDALEQQEKAKRPQVYTDEIPGGREIRKPIFVTAAIIAVLVIVLGITFDQMFFLGLILPAVLFLLSFKKTEKRTVTRESLNENLIRESDERLERIKNEAVRKFTEEEAELHQLKSEVDQIGDEIRKNEGNLKERESSFLEVKKNYEEKRQELDEKKTQVTRFFGLMEASEKALRKASEGIEENQEMVSKEELEDLQRDIIKQGEEIITLKEQLQQIFTTLECEDLDGLSNKYYAYKNHQDRLERRTVVFRENEKKYEDYKERHQKAEEEIRQHFRIYKELDTIEEAFIILPALKGILTEKDRASLQLDAADDHRKELEMKNSIEELEMKMQTLKEKVEVLSLEEGTDFTDLDEKIRIRKKVEEKDQMIQEIREEIISLESEVREKYRRKKNISQIENEIEVLSEKHVEMESDYEALKLAKDTLIGAFNKMQSTFGPKVNEETQKIFKRLTDGRYDEVLVSRDMSIAFQDNESKKMYDWAFLSGGTIDQAYLSLRLAISDLIIQDQKKRPLFLDDVFTQYDDRRAQEGLRFLHEFISQREVPVQSVLFTCHERIVNWAESLPDTVVSKLNA